MSMTQARHPRCFVSYGHEDEHHSQWIEEFATQLRRDGVDVTLDLWHAEPGDQLPHFMEKAVRDNDFVIPVCTPSYKEKTDTRVGGVGYEGDLMTAVRFSGGSSKKFIPVLRRGTWKEAAPSWLMGRFYVDLTGDPYSETNYKMLLRTLHGAAGEVPPLGPRPAFLSSQDRTDPLRSTTSSLQLASVRPDLPDSISPKVGIITALVHESAAVQAVFGESKRLDVPGSGAGRVYWLIEVRSPRGVRQVVVAQAGMGNNAAGTRATLLLSHFPSVDSIIMCGIAGGIPHPDRVEDHVRLGDIVVSNAKGVVQYDFVKRTVKRKRGHRRDSTNVPSAQCRALGGG